METTTCPECDAPAEVRGRSVWESTDGPVEHVRVECIRRHWFLMSVASLAAAHQHSARLAAAELSWSARRRR
jgi:hypothetical protein